MTIKLLIIDKKPFVCNNLSSEGGREMNLMNSVNFLAISCTDPAVAQIIKIIKNVLTIIWIAVPVLIILWGTIDLLKAVIAQKDEEFKKAWSILLKRLIYGIFIFLLTAIVYWAFASLGGQTVQQCL